MAHYKVKQEACCFQSFVYQLKINIAPLIHWNCYNVHVQLTYNMRSIQQCTQFEVYSNVQSVSIQLCTNMKYTVMVYTVNTYLFMTIRHSDSLFQLYSTFWEDIPTYKKIDKRQAQPNSANLIGVKWYHATEMEPCKKNSCQKNHLFVPPILNPGCDK